MGKIIIKNAVKREPGFIYYVDSQGNICRAVSVIAKKQAKSKKAKEKK